MLRRDVTLLIASSLRVTCKHIHLMEQVKISFGEGRQQGSPIRLVYNGLDFPRPKVHGSYVALIYLANMTNLLGLHVTLGKPVRSSTN